LSHSGNIHHRIYLSNIKEDQPTTEVDCIAC
jgi:hypothetical protein